QHVVEAGPDVKHALARELRDLTQRRGPGHGERLRRLLGAEDEAAGRAAFFEARQPSVQRIEVEEERVGGREAARILWTQGGKAQHRIGPVAVTVHLM